LLICFTQIYKYILVFIFFRLVPETEI
jgi:hypothetical protein